VPDANRPQFLDERHPRLLRSCDFFMGGKAGFAPLFGLLHPAAGLSVPSQATPAVLPPPAPGPVF